MKHTRLPKLSLLGACACAALSITPAWAAPILLTAGSSASTTAGTTTQPDNTNATWVSNSVTGPNAADGRSGANAWANQYGTYAVSSYAEGKGSASSFARLLYELTNTSAIAQVYSMNLHIYGGTLSAALNNFGSGTPTLIGAEFLEASYLSKVSVTKGATTSEPFKSQATIRNSSTGVVLSRTGTTLAGAPPNADSGYYSWNTDDYLVDLGLVGAGESFFVEIDLMGSVEANVGTYDFGFDCGGGGGYGGENGFSFGTSNPAGQTATAAVIINPVCFKGTAQARYGDPVNFFPGDPDAYSKAPLVTFGSTAAGVPEPGSLPLAALALLGAAAVARRRRA